MSTDDPLIEAVGDVLMGIAEELAFLRPGEPTGLARVGALVSELEQLPSGTLPDAFVEGLVAARGWLALLGAEMPGTDSASLRGLVAWHDWAVDFAGALRAGFDWPPMPAAAMPGEATTGAVETTSAEAPPAPPVPAAREPPRAAGDSPSFTLRIAEDGELLREFHSESLELLRQIEQAVLQLEADPGERGAVNAIFRAFHTFKGSAGFLQIVPLRDLAHELESLLGAVREGSLTVSRAVIDTILAGADVLAACVEAVGAQLAGRHPPGPVAIASPGVIARAQALLHPENRAGTAAPPSLVAEETAEIPREARPPDAGDRPPAARAGGDGFVRLDSGKLDELVDLVGELVVAQAAVLESQALHAAADLDLAHAVRRLVRTTRALQRNAMALRMVPIGGTFRKMARLVRDLAATQGKPLRLVLDGEDTELDRHLVERLGDPLIHMVRNAVGHGIESPDERRAAGKDPVGTIELAARHAHGGITVSIRDDGRGLDPERLRARAIQQGIVMPGQALDDGEALELIFLPGFSTSTTVTDLSGRGVGMDVVRGQIEALRGSVDIASEPGKGVSFTLRLPLTLASIDGLLVGLGQDRYVIPSLAVRETVKARPGDIATVHGRGELLSLRGRQLPVLRLSRLLHRPARVQRPEDGLLLVVESGASTRAVLVDEILGRRDLVIKALGETFDGQSLVSGGAILGDGSIGLVLDVDALLRGARSMPTAPAIRGAPG